jgi:hypothetical protein
MVGWISLGNDRSVHTTVRAGWACADPPLSPAPIGSDSIRAVDGPPGQRGAGLWDANALVCESGAGALAAAMMRSLRATLADRPALSALAMRPSGACNVRPLSQREAG